MSDEIIVKNKITRYDIGNWLIMAGIFVITTLEWHFYDWYQTFTKYGTLITMVVLIGVFFCYVDIKAALKDKFFWVMVATDAIALINLIIIGSNFGCILVVIDLMLILYLADKIEFSKRQSFVTLIYVAFFFIYWTVDVKGYFKGYNTNYGGLILITGFAFLMILMQIANEKLGFRYGAFVGEYGKSEGFKYWWKRFFWYPFLYLFLIALAFNIISWYRSRTALMGLIALLVILVCPARVVSKKTLFYVVSVLSTAGAIMFAGLYIFLGSLSNGEGIQLFYKSVISGRNEIWNELFNAYLSHPITGIGSAYKMKLDFMEGMLEAHSAMLDILFIHGILVFIPVCGMLIYRLIGLRQQVEKSTVGKMIFAAIICMLVTGFFENYYIVQPFSLMLLSLFALKSDNLS